VYETVTVLASGATPTHPWYRQAKENQARREGWPEVLAP